MFFSFSIHIILIALINNANADDVNSTTVYSTSNEVFLDDDSVHFWTSLQFPNPYPPQDQYLIVKCDPGYSVSITIETLDLDGSNGDFLIIKPGTTLDGDSKGKVFTYKLKTKKMYLVSSNTIFLSLQVSGKNELQKSGFSLSYKRVGEYTNPTEPPTSTPWPIPSTDESGDLIVYVSRSPEINSTKTWADFKMAVSQMAIKYCEANDILISKNITVENVQIHYITDCPFAWPAHETCIKIFFAVPVDTNDSKWSSYQLTTYHLNQMWHEFGNQYLEPYGMAIYAQPGSSYLNWWIIIICITIVLFVLVLYSLKVFGAKIPNYQFKTQKGNGINTIPDSKSSKSIGIAYSQQTPSMFGNHSNEYYYYPTKDTHPPHDIIDNANYDSDDEFVIANFKNNESTS